MTDDICTHCQHLLGDEAVTVAAAGFDLTFCKLGCVTDWHATRTEMLNRHLGLSYADAHPAEMRNGAQTWIAGYESGRRDERMWRAGWLAGRRSTAAPSYLPRDRRHANV